MNISRRIAAIATIVLWALPALAADRSMVNIPVPGKPFFVQLKPIFVPVIGKTDVSHQVSLAVAVEIADGADAKSIEPKMPMLDDAVLSDVYRYVQQRGGIGPPEAETALKARLRDTAARVLNPVSVTEVEIEEFFEQQR